MTEYRKLALLAIRAQAVAVIALTDALLAEDEAEGEDDCTHPNREKSVIGGDDEFYCLDCKKTFPCPHDRTQDASTMGCPRKFCLDCKQMFAGNALEIIGAALDS